MVTKQQLKKDIAQLVGISYQYLPATADRFFAEIRECEEWADCAVSSLPDLCREQARAMVAAGRHDLGLSDQEICKMALAAHREARCGVSAAIAPAEESTPADEPMSAEDLYWKQLEAYGYSREYPPQQF